ncbi:MAG: hypothetical protein C1O27_000798 [Chloroflexi bacterium]|nr:MAG: hypothetical protein C1O27_000798 [Chloroflexota bacterium]
MPRLIGLVVIVLFIALLAVMRPRLPASLLARGWRAINRSDGGDPAWVIYYLGDMPKELIPSDARSLEDTVRTVGAALLAIPVFLLLALFVLAP